MTFFAGSNNWMVLLYHNGSATQPYPLSPKVISKINQVINQNGHLTNNDKWKLKKRNP